MTLSEKAEKIYKKIMEQKEKSFLITEEELKKAKFIKISDDSNKSPSKNLDQVIKKIEIKIPPFDDLSEEINPVKIQKSEIENLYREKNEEAEQQIKKCSELNILDKLVSNTKIFLKNLVYAQNTKDLFHYLDINLSTFFYIRSFVVFFNNLLVHHFNFDKEKIPLLIEFVKNFPANFENDFCLKQIEIPAQQKTNDTHYYIFPIFIANKNEGYIIIELDPLFSQNEYFLDFLAMILSLIPSVIPPIIPSLNIRNNFFEKLFEKISTEKVVYLYSYINPPFYIIQSENLNKYLLDYQNILESEDMININYKKFISLKINENIENKFKSLNLKYDLKSNPTIKYKIIDSNECDIKKEILIYI